MTITSSQIVDDAVQVDGRRAITEVHTDHVGKEHRFVWMAANGQNATTVMAARVAIVEAQLAEQEIARNLAEVEGG